MLNGKHIQNNYSNLCGVFLRDSLSAAVTLHGNLSNKWPSKPPGPFAHCGFLHLNRVLPFQRLFYFTHSCTSFNIQWKSHILQEAFSSSPTRLSVFSPCLRTLLPYLHCKLLCHIPASLTRLWRGRRVTTLSFPSPLPNTVTGHMFSQGLLNEFMHERMNAWDQCPPLGDKMSLKNALPGRAIFKDISTSLASIGLLTHLPPPCPTPHSE